MFNWLNMDTAQGIIRAGLAFGGGILVGKGTMTPEQVQTLTQHLTDPGFLGAMAAIVTAVWSVIHKQTPVATTPPTTPTK